MTTTNDIIRAFQNLRETDKNKPLTLNGLPIQGVSIQEDKKERIVVMKDKDGNPMFEEDEDGKLVKDEEGNFIPQTITKTIIDVKIVFSTGKQNEEFKTPAAAVSALLTLTPKERMSPVCYGTDDIFIIGESYAFADRVNIDTDESLEEYGE